MIFLVSQNLLQSTPSHISQNTSVTWNRVWGNDGTHNIKITRQLGTPNYYYFSTCSPQTSWKKLGVALCYKRVGHQYCKPRKLLDISM